jgi:CheY-like chemotaxis protein
VKKEKMMENSSQLKVLLAEDNKINQRLAGIIFRQLGVSCDLADDGRQAAERYFEGRHDLVLMDIQMPEMDGLESSRRIRAIERESNNGHRAVIIALSASEPFDILNACSDAGIDDCLEKPLQGHKVQAIINQYFQ